MSAEYTVNNKLLTIKDIALLQRQAKHGLDLEALLPILNKVVCTPDGTLAEDLPFEHLEPIVEAITRRVVPANPT